MKGKDLTTINQLDNADVENIFSVADNFLEIAKRPIKRVPTLRGWTVVNCFYEASTRTRISFEVAAKRLGADSVNFSSSGSSMGKGETILDTAKNLFAMAPDLLIVRDSRSGTADFLAKKIPCGVINAGDGQHEHPTQALLDCYTIRQIKGKIEGLNIAIIGDIAHSRVARSNVLLMGKLGAKVTLLAPPTLYPPGVSRWGVKIATSLDDAIKNQDVVMALRIQRERQGVVNVPSEREYFEHYGISGRRLKLARKDVTVMHPGPMNRGVEISSDVADGPYSVILEQVTNGVAVRMAILYLLTVGRGKNENTN